MFRICSVACRFWYALVRFAGRAAARGALAEAGTSHGQCDHWDHSRLRNADMA